MSERIDESGRTIFTTEDGVDLILNSVSPLLIAKLQSVGTLPDVPTRKVRLDLDGFESTYQEEELSEEDLQDDDEKRRWKAYTEARDAVLSKRQDGFMKAIFAKGVTIELSNVEAWKEEQEYFGIEAPTHPLDLKVEYIQTEVVKSAEDMVGIITGVLGKSGVPPEELESMRAMFRSGIRRNTAREVENAEREMGMERELYPDESGPLLAGVAP